MTTICGERFSMQFPFAECQHKFCLNEQKGRIPRTPSWASRGTFIGHGEVAYVSPMLQNEGPVFPGAPDSRNLP